MSVPRNQPRLYYGIWERIKQEDCAQLLIKHPKMVARVRKAVIKEKYQDGAFHIMNDGANFKLVITYDPSVGIMTFKLVSKEVELGMSKKVIV